eukprot:Skav232266  [mRNA]  locus=scaffold882:44282:46103:- [translate_table: standard]
MVWMHDLVALHGPWDNMGGPCTVEPAGTQVEPGERSGSANETLVQNQSAELLKSVPLPMEIGTLSKLNLTRPGQHQDRQPMDLPPPYVSPEGRAMLSGASVMRASMAAMATRPGGSHGSRKVDG